MACQGQAVEWFLKTTLEDRKLILESPRRPRGLFDVEREM